MQREIRTALLLTSLALLVLVPSSIIASANTPPYSITGHFNLPSGFLVPSYSNGFEKVVPMPIYVSKSNTMFIAATKSSCSFCDYTYVFAYSGSGKMIGSPISFFTSSGLLGPGFQYDSKDNRVYVNQGECATTPCKDYLVAISATTDKVVGNLSLPGNYGTSCCVTSIAYAQNVNELYVAFGANLYVVKASTDQLVTQIHVVSVTAGTANGQVNSVVYDQKNNNIYADYSDSKNNPGGYNKIAVTPDSKNKITKRLVDKGNPEFGAGYLILDETYNVLYDGGGGCGVTDAFNATSNTFLYPVGGQVSNEPNSYAATDGIVSGSYALVTFQPGQCDTTGNAPVTYEVKALSSSSEYRTIPGDIKQTEDVCGDVYSNAALGVNFGDCYSGNFTYTGREHIDVLSALTGKIITRIADPPGVSLLAFGYNKPAGMEYAVALGTRTIYEISS